MDSVRPENSEVIMAEISDIKTTSRAARLKNDFEKNMGHLRKYLEETFNNLDCDICSLEIGNNKIHVWKIKTFGLIDEVKS